MHAYSTFFVQSTTNLECADLLRSTRLRLVADLADHSPKRRQVAALQNYTTNPIGSFLTRFPVAAKIAFATAGATGGTPGSPTPVGFSVLGTM